MSGFFRADVPAPDPDGIRSGAIDLGDITDQDGVIFRRDSVDGTDDVVAYYKFTLTVTREVGLGLRKQDANGDLYLEDAGGEVLYSSESGGSADEWILENLNAGTYYIRMEAQEAESNDYGLRYGVEPATQQQSTPENGATSAQQGSGNGCPGNEDAPTPTPAAVTSVPIVVTSTTDEYFVLYVTFDVDSEVLEIPVAVTRGEAGTTTLAENVEALPAERYKVDKYLITDPADVDGDCLDDITELEDLESMNPVNPATSVEISDGAVIMSNQDTFETLAIGSHLKYMMFDMHTARPGVYFINTNTYDHHEDFLDFVGLRAFQNRMIKGNISYDRNRVAPDGSLGVYRYSYSALFNYPNYSFEVAARSYTVLAASMPSLGENLVFHIPNQQLRSMQSELPLLRASRIPFIFDGDIYSQTVFLALNPGEGHGRLQALKPDERPHPRDVALYETLPNELPRVAGIISTVPQTPLSHVNLRAVQDGIPNSYIRDALDKTDITSLIGGYVHYTVTEDGWELRAATPAEVEAQYEASRPAQAQTPERDLSVTEIRLLSEVGFEDWRAFGVKAANVAVLGTLGFLRGPSLTGLRYRSTSTMSS